ncbi:MAG: SH3 domain-containing protein [Hellea sp.]|nr:SH3 domain-containing protein [Hellea sp.]MDG1667231.1 SH3 domain-containing protein [Hellea sp.]
MIKVFKIYLIIWGGLVIAPDAFASEVGKQYIQSENPKKMTQKNLELENIYRVPPEKTRSGFAVPRYVSLKVGKANGRVGPSTKHKILWQYRRKGLPLIVVAETDNWRKVRDMKGDESWVHRPALSGIRNVITTEEATIHKNASVKAETMALTEKDTLLRLEECRKNWCKVSYKKIQGWIQRSEVWGAAE